MKHNTRHTAAAINPKKGFRIHFLVFLLVTPLVWLAWYLTDTTYPWPAWSTASWVTGVLFHYLGVFVFKPCQQQCAAPASR
ncbi:2TM domain-containing protein [Chitinophaga sp. YR627]|uniref:2TM domain-containing protein n=1 Tax=Chitinophaga sp. YR627 TaxID=1881041 RepID=UPI0008E75A77|nr:2TM domain-containing protein [Chitinophaga sp. YR627]SFP11887.1 2TM domain-containing protein [Chitinophaga sp. YR627]